MDKQVECNYQLSKWVKTKPECVSVTESLIKYKAPYEIKEKNGDFAVFIPEEKDRYG